MVSASCSVDDERVLLFVGATNLAQNGYKDHQHVRWRNGSPGVTAKSTQLRRSPHRPLHARHVWIATRRRNPKIRSDIPVILTAGYINAHERHRAGRLGIRTILIKPVNTKELLGALADLFEKRAELQRN
jgi:DNA-binding NtrC family response regulator